VASIVASLAADLSHLPMKLSRLKKEQKEYLRKAFDLVQSVESM
jgi:hypothetical protein